MGAGRIRQLGGVTGRLAGAGASIRVRNDDENEVALTLERHAGPEVGGSSGRSGTISRGCDAELEGDQQHPV